MTKPESTGALRNPAMKPMRSAPISSSKPPTIAASSSEAAMKSALPTLATAPTAASDMMDRSAAGPAASTGLVPISAYTTSGSMLA